MSILFSLLVFVIKRGEKVFAFRSNAQGATYYSGVTKSPHPLSPFSLSLSPPLWEGEKLFPSPLILLRSVIIAAAAA